MYTRELHGPEVEVCSFCGEPTASGWWMGHQTIAACHSCALNKLPKLIAEAVVGEYGHRRPLPVLRQLQQVVEKNFWEGVSLAVLRAAQADDAPGKRMEETDD